MTILSWRALSNFRFYRWRVTILFQVFLGLSVYLLYTTDGTTTTTDITDDYYPHPGLDLPTINPGLHYDLTMTAITKHWPTKTRTFDVAHGATP